MLRSKLLEILSLFVSLWSKKRAIPKALGLSDKELKTNVRNNQRKLMIMHGHLFPTQIIRPVSIKHS